MKEKNALFLIKILKSIIDVYFSTFFVLYFFQVANYEVLPLAKYYLTLYVFIGIGFFLLGNAMKRNIKMPYFRIGISLEAIYIAAIMLLKEKIIDYIFLVAIIKGFADAFYYYPMNLLGIEKVSNEERQKWSAHLNIVGQIISILIPLLLGIALTKFTYINLGKIFFMLFIVMFVLAYFIKDSKYNKADIDLKGFKELVKKNKNLKTATLIPFLSGLTYSSGVMGLVITLSKINNFKTNLNLGYVDSICAVLTLIICTLFASKINKKSFKVVLYCSGIISLLVMTIFSIIPTKATLIIYLITSCSAIVLITLISDLTIANMSNSSELKTTYKPEFYMIRDCILSISRSCGYLVLFIIASINMHYINYILIFCGISLLLEAILIGNLKDEAI